jgi:hypothetical protein
VAKNKIIEHQHHTFLLLTVVYSKMDDNDDLSSRGTEDGGALSNDAEASKEVDDLDVMSRPSSLFEKTERKSDKPMRKRPTFSNPGALDIQTAINYKGATMKMACQQGNLPVCVLLWGIAAAKRVSLIDPDSDGNNPMHYAVLSDNSEV